MFIVKTRSPNYTQISKITVGQVVQDHFVGHLSAEDLSADARASNCVEFDFDGWSNAVDRGYSQRCGTCVERPASTRPEPAQKRSTGFVDYTVAPRP
jgi:hypothetical protein